ncbi:hypothetical protein C8Q80DRAFT_739875 [Daedaleopsis nitida]|nr:hypothetical protein C8Q80DRAFT_739875 [Daedaleopsis nitida]
MWPATSLFLTAMRTGCECFVMLARTSSDWSPPPLRRYLRSPVVLRQLDRSRATMSYASCGDRLCLVTLGECGVYHFYWSLESPVPLPDRVCIWGHKSRAHCVFSVWIASSLIRHLAFSRVPPDRSSRRAFYQCGSGSVAVIARPAPSSLGEGRSVGA